MPKVWPEYWVWWERPGLPHRHASEYGGVQCSTLSRALDVVKQKIREGYIVRVYDGHINAEEPPP